MSNNVIVNVCLEYWAVGGAERFFQRLSRKLPQYKWIFTKQMSEQADIVIYSNAHKFYEQAKLLNKPTILRITGPRSYSLPQPEDLRAVICSSNISYGLSKHKNKVLIYNGIDFEMLKCIKPIKNDLLYGCARVGMGQAPEAAIQYALKNNRHLTITGSKQHLAENTYNILRKKYPQVNWTGLLDESTMLRYVKGCKAGIMPTSVHGISNFIIECVSMDKPLINLGGVEVVNKADIDINITAQKYKKLIENCLLDTKK